MSSEEPYEPIESCEDEEDGEGGEYEEYEDIEEDIYDDECLREERQLLSSEKKLCRANQSSFPAYISSEIAELIIKAEEDKAKNGLIAGFVCILLGFILSIIGVTGFINWSFAFGGINSSLTNAAPGVLLMVVGLLIIIVTNHKVTVQK